MPTLPRQRADAGTQPLYAPHLRARNWLDAVKFVPWAGQNYVLRALPPAERARFVPHMRAVSLPLGAVPYRLAGTILKQEFQRHGQLLRILLRYTLSLITQMAHVPT